MGLLKLTAPLLIANVAAGVLGGDVGAAVGFCCCSIASSNSSLSIRLTQTMVSLSAPPQVISKATYSGSVSGQRENPNDCRGILRCTRKGEYLLRRFIMEHAWTKCGIWESDSRQILLLEGNLCNFEG